MSKNYYIAIACLAALVFASLLFNLYDEYFPKQKILATEQEILQYWFGELTDDRTYPTNKVRMWFTKNPTVDKEIEKKFALNMFFAASGDLDHWKNSPRGRLALLILLDQMPRNVYRDKPQAFAYDKFALDIALEGIDKGDDLKVYPIERVFYYLPLEHSEDPEMQKLSVQKFKELMESVPSEDYTKYRTFYEYALDHQHTIEKFSRFPHRNKALNRTNTPEEEEYLNPKKIDLSSWTPEQKIGQLLLAHFNGEKANKDAQHLIQDLNIGGIIYYEWANGLQSPEQVENLSRELQELAFNSNHKIPLLIAVDQEGGSVARLKKGFTSLPSNAELGKLANPKEAYLFANVAGRELRAVGVNFNLAPVVDINSNPSNLVMKDRSYGNDPEMVITMAHAAIDGYHDAGISVCLKHFPGHGDVTIDSHEGLPIINRSKEELLALELLTFKALSTKADSVMTAHILVPAVDAQNCATVSPSVLNLLRNECLFVGPIVADSLIMKGLLVNTGSIDEAALRALQAGCDLLILGGKLLNNQDQTELSIQDVKRIHGHLVAALEDGRLSASRVDDALKKVLKLKGL